MLVLACQITQILDSGRPCYGLKHDMSSPMKIGAESMELPLGPITRARAKKFQDAVASYIARLWSDGLIAHKTPSSTSLIRNFLQADFSLCQLNLAQFGT